MNYLRYKIESWRLPRVLLFSFAGMFVFLSLFTLREAMYPERIELDEALTLHGSIISMSRSFFKSSLLLSFEIEGYCSEFTCPGFRPFHYQEFKDDFSPGLAVDFVVRKSDLDKIDSCQRCEIVALKSESGSYLTLSERNDSSYTAKRIVAGGITGALFTAGLICLVLAIFSARAGEQRDEFWERRAAFRRKPF
jgi:hypothetical protein